MKTHTPGPWYYVDYAGSFVIQDGPYYEDPNILCYDDEFGIGDSEKAEANAKLAAAAPDLLKACIDVMAGGYGCAPSVELMDKLKLKCEAAIKRATV